MPDIRTYRRDSWVSYEDLSVEDLFEEIPRCVISAPLISDAENWVEAENIFEVRKCVLKWINLIEQGIANEQYPEGNVSQERADNLIDLLESEFLSEVRLRRVGLGANAGPGLTELLNPHAKRRMAEEIFSILKSYDQIKEEAKQKFYIPEKS